MRHFALITSTCSILWLAITEKKQGIGGGEEG